MLELLVAEPQARFREALCEFLRRQPQLRLLGQGAEALPLLHALPVTQPGLLLLGLRRGDARDFDILRAVLAGRPQLPVLVLGSYDEPALVSAWRLAGARGYLLRDLAFEVLPALLARLPQGRAFLLGVTAGQSPSIADGPVHPDAPNVH